MHIHKFKVEKPIISYRSWQKGAYPYYLKNNKTAVAKPVTVPHGTRIEGTSTPML